MKRVCRGVALLIVAIAVMGASCCDQGRHDALEQMEQQVGMCAARGGIPIYEMAYDNGGHSFKILKQCAFPCDQRIAVEK